MRLTMHSQHMGQQNHKNLHHKSGHWMPSQYLGRWQHQHLRRSLCFNSQHLRLQRDTEMRHILCLAQLRFWLNESLHWYLPSIISWFRLLWRPWHGANPKVRQNVSNCWFVSRHCSKPTVQECMYFQCNLQNLPWPDNHELRSCLLGLPSSPIRRWSFSNLWACLHKWRSQTKWQDQILCFFMSCALWTQWQPVRRTVSQTLCHQRPAIRWSDPQKMCSGCRMPCQHLRQRRLDGMRFHMSHQHVHSQQFLCLHLSWHPFHGQNQPQMCFCPHMS